MSAAVPDTAEELLGGYETWMLSWNASANTVRQRLTSARRFSEQWPDPSVVTTNDLVTWLGQQPLAQWSLVTYYNALRGFFGWLASTGQISSDPTVGLRRPRQPNHRPKPLTAAEVDAVLSSATGNVRAWLVLALYTGLRAHEIAKIRGEDVQQDVIFVSGKGGKEAYIPTHPEVWELAQHRPRVGWWFPTRSQTGHVAATSITTLTTRAFRAAGITQGSIHRCRHTYATRLLRAGVNVRVVQELMRHSSLSTTAAYCAVDEDEKRAAVNLLGGGI